MSKKNNNRSIQLVNGIQCYVTNTSAKMNLQHHAMFSITSNLIAVDPLVLKFSYKHMHAR